MLLGSVVISAAVVAAWFPAEALLHQRAGLAGAQAQLATLHEQDAALAQEARNLGDAGEIGRIARQEYQLVNPGQQAYEVLPPAGAAAPSAGTPYAGDPGVGAPSAPSAAAELPPGSPTTSTSTTTTTVPPHAASQPGLLSRMVHSLEFWR
jgi:hypothetical protein